MSEYIEIYYHHGGLLTRDQNGRMAYVGGKVESLGKEDVDYVNLNDICTICEHYGYERCERILWLKPDVPNFEEALKPLATDADINAMCEAGLKNGNEMHVYFDNCIHRPKFVDEAQYLQDTEDGGEEQEGEEEDGGGEQEGEEEDGRDEEMEKEEGKEVQVPEEEVEEEEMEEEEGHEEEEGNNEDCRSKRKMGLNNEDEEDEEDEEEEDNLVEEEEEKDDGHMSFEDEGYDYYSEELRTPPLSDEEPDVRVANPKFNDQSQFSHVQLELGMEFASLGQFKNAIIDYNIALENEFIWVKNDKVRARAKCHIEDCSWMIFCWWNSKISVFKSKHLRKHIPVVGNSTLKGLLVNGLPKN